MLIYINSRLSVCNPTMFKSERKLVACRALAGTSSSVRTDTSAQMSLCRACLVLLSAEDAGYDLYCVKDLADKFVGCMRAGGDELRFLTAPVDEEHSPQIVLKCICECCYQLVQKFYDFQRMCEESFRNFEKLLLEVSSNDKALKSNQEVKDAPPMKVPSECLPAQPEKLIVQVQSTVGSVTSQSIEDIEEVYIIEDDAAKQSLGREKLSITTPPGIPKRSLGVRHKIECNICGRGFYKSSLYEAHMQRHQGQQPYKCTIDQCDKVYARANLLVSHLREVHQNERTTYRCTQPNCNKTYTAIRSLNYHVRRQHFAQVDTGDPKHICEKCGKCYGRKALLTRHQWVHRSKRECIFACKHCEQRFYTSQNLQDHILRRHSSHKQLWRCKRCSRIFTTRFALSTHTKKHLRSCIFFSSQKD